MAAYATTTTVKGKKAAKVAPNLAVITGQVALSNYNSTLAEITGITKNFRSLHSVVGAISSNNKICTWIAASKAFKCYVPNTGAEVANDQDCGTIDFIATGTV